MNNQHQELVEEKVADFRVNFWKISGESAPDLDRKQDAYVTKMLQDLIDTVSMIVREEEAVEYNKIIDILLKEERERAGEYMTPENGDAYLQALDKTPPNKV